MRLARLTWKGAFHHVMNRGLNKQKIFENDNLKSKYIELMAIKANKYEIKVFAYCVMNNHFHVCLENTSGNLSKFMKSVNGSYGQFYRKITNSKGYVFEDRFKSTLIQDEKYLSLVVMYILQNPVRSGYVMNPFDYQWSSINEYYSDRNNSFIDKTLVEEEFSSKKRFSWLISSGNKCDLNEQLINKVRFCGDKHFGLKLVKKTSAEGFVSEIKLSKMRLIEKIQKSFEYKHSVNLSELNIRSHSGKKLRNKFLLLLRNELDLTYKEIHKMNLFNNLTLQHIRKIIHNLNRKV